MPALPDFAKPPPTWPADKLFRLLTQGPRPALTLPAISFLPSLSLSVRAVASSEVMRLVDSFGESALRERVVLETVHCDGEPAFGSSEEMGLMSPDAYLELEVAVFSALHAVSPTYVQSDVDAWRMRLTEGANHPLNFNVTRLLAASFDWMGGTEQPERFFGVPLREICDGPLMAYRAAIEIIGRLRKNS